MKKNNEKTEKTEKIKKLAENLAAANAEDCIGLHVNKVGSLDDAYPIVDDNNTIVYIHFCSDPVEDGRMSTSVGKYVDVEEVFEKDGDTLSHYRLI